MEQEIRIKMELELNTEDLKVVDKLMKKMLSSLDVEELTLINDCKIIKTLAEMEISSNVFDEKCEE